MSDPSVPIVLVVEDEVFIRFVAADALSANGFTVLEAGDAAEAIEILAANLAVAVMFTDVNMPGDMDGLALAAYVAQERPEIRIVVTSGQQRYSDAALPCQCKFISKPYLEADLAAVIAEQVAKNE